MEKPRRENLRDVVKKARGKIEGSLAGQLAGFGFFRDTEPAPKEDLRLGPAQEAIYPRLLDVILREGRAVGKEGRISPEGVDRFVRESGATWVNRLAGLRALEVRGLLSPAAAFVSDEYGGASPRSIRLRETAPAEGRMSREESIRAGIEEACLELSASVRVLFDLSDEYSLLWPDLTALREVLQDFSAEVTVGDWSEPDVLGWVYQYYNTDANAELKKRKNKTTGFTYKPDDIPIANQFYTPHWVVRVLADNTLGRLWLEAQGRLPLLDTEPYRLVEARAGIPHANDEPEAFDKWIVEEPDPLTDKTLDRLCRFLVPLPSPPLPRARKSVREIRVLDPACGSGHFLLYAFDLLFAMYREAEPDLDLSQIPALILVNNLFGIDIDLRAAQLAAFSLYLKARGTLARIDPQATLDVRGLNIVVADAHIGNDPRKAVFLERYKDDPEIRQLYAKVISDLDNTNVLGSLIKVRTEFESLFGRVRDAKDEGNWIPTDQQTLIDVSRQPELSESFRSFSGRTWTIGELLADLHRFEQEIMPAQDIGARLFYTDLERSVGLLGVLSAHYDVVLMNPPYAEMPPETRDYLAGNKKKKIPAHYARTSQSLDAAFLEQGVDLLCDGGVMGALVPRALMFYASHEEMRREILAGQSHLAFLHDYGLGILDGATVRTAGLVVGKNPTAQVTADRKITFQRLSYYHTDLKVERFISTLPTYARRGPIEGTEFFVARLVSLEKVPGMPYSYWASESLRDLFQQHPVLDYSKVLSPKGLQSRSVGRVLQGIATQDDVRFTRFWWELAKTGEELPEGWRVYAKGGANVLFYTRLDLAVDWRDGGAAIKDWIREGLCDHPTRHLRNLDFQGREGLTWRAVAWTTRRFGHVPPGAMFSNRGSMVFTEVPDLRSLLGFLNSELAAALLLCQTNEREWHVSEVAALPVSTALQGNTLTSVAGLIQSFRRQHEGDETCRDFAQPELRRAWKVAARRLDLHALLSETIELHNEANRDIKNQLAEIDNEVLELYRISHEDRALIEREMQNRPLSESGYSALELDGEAEAVAQDGEEDLQVAGTELSSLRARDLVARWLSDYLKQVLESDDDGIISVWPTRTETGLIVRLRESIDRDLGKEAADAFVAQAPQYLGTDDVIQWLATSRDETIEIGGKKVKLPVGFFPWHVDLYRKRPIFWLLSSEGFEKGKTRFRFQAYLHYIKLTADTLPRLVSHHLEPAIEDYVQKELSDSRLEVSRLEGKPLAVAKAAMQEWLNTLDALKGLRAALEAVIQGPQKAEGVPANAKWLARTIAAVRGGQDLGHGYKPDVDYGVRVNITPLVEKRLLPKLALKKLGG